MNILEKETEMKTIGMVIAIDEELKAFLKKFDYVKNVKAGAYDVFECGVTDKKVFAVKTGAGELCAAAATQFLITAFGAELVINAGVCGNLSKNLKILDTVVVKEVVHYQYDTSAVDNCAVGKYEQFESVNIPSDEIFREKLRSAFPFVKEARCASGDKFIAEKDDKAYLVRQFGAEICEMESAGIIITCKKNRVPCLIVKSVSDDCDDMDFMTYVEKAAAIVSDIVIKTIAML